jgi:hypothetical protein
MANERLIVMSGPRQGESFEIIGSLSIGRNQDSGIVLEDPQVSRRHAEVEPGGAPIDRVHTRHGGEAALDHRGAVGG